MVRRLTAIMFTDMVGYTALMQEDEYLARRNRDRLREILERTIGAHGGRILQFYGDGTLSVFDSAIAGVQCAVEIQEACGTGDDTIPVRIGLHTGDVVHDEGGVFGDGVNVASRIEGLGVPGSVLISEKVYDEVKNQRGIRTRSLGQFNLKNVKRPMEVHAVVNDGLAVPGESEMRASRTGRGKSIAVLPFVNMSSDPENEFFSDGMTEEIINVLTRVNGLQVTARTSSFAFKHHNEDVRAIAEKLGVTHVLEGSVRRAGDRVRVAAQLICAADGYHLFSDVYDRQLSDVFALQDEIAAAIVEQLADHLAPVNTTVESVESDPAPVRPRSSDSAAYAEYLRGRFEWARWSPDGARNAIACFKRSASLDADCALPASGIATAYVFLGATGHMPPAEAFAEAERHAQRALELNEASAEAHVAMGTVHLFYHWDWEAAYRSFQKALTLTPGSAEAHQLYAMYLKSVGDVDEAIGELHTAVELDPLSPVMRHSLAEAYLHAGRFDEAEEELEAILAEHHTFRAATETLGWVHLERGDPERALTLFQTLPTLAGHKYAGAAPRGRAFARLGRFDEARAMLALLEERERAQPDVSVVLDKALIHQGLGETDEVFRYLDQVVEQRVGAAIFLGMNQLWGEELRRDPRFGELLERIGHPSVVPAAS